MWSHGALVLWAACALLTGGGGLEGVHGDTGGSGGALSDDGGLNKEIIIEGSTRLAEDENSLNGGALDLSHGVIGELEWTPSIPEGSEGDTREDRSTKAIIVEESTRLAEDERDLTGLVLAGMSRDVLQSRVEEGETDCPINCSCSTIEDVNANCELARTYVTIEGKLGSSVKITCGTEEGSIEQGFICSELPSFSYGGDKEIRLELQYCPVPPDLNCVGHKMGAQNVSQLYIHSAPEGGITEEQLRGLDALEVLAIYGQKNQTMPFPPLSTLPNLRALTISTIQVTLPAVLIYPQLKSLELLAVEIKVLPPGVFRRLEHLERLNLFANRIEDLNVQDFEGLTSLKALELSNNKLRSLEAVISASPPLTHLNAFANDIQQLPPLKNLSQLEQLNIMNNRVHLTLLPLALAYLPKLTSVNLSRSRITSLPPDLLKATRSLTSLNLAYNNLPELPPNLFQDTRRLEELDVSYNKLVKLDGDVFQSLVALKKLNLDHNEIIVLPPKLLAGKSLLKHFSMKYNKLSTLLHYTFNGATRLEEIYLDHNEIVDPQPWESHYESEWSPFERLSDLRTLSLSHNLLSAAVRVAPTAVYFNYLDMSYNNVTLLNFEDVDFISNTVTADFRYNKIESIYPQELPLLSAGPSDGPSGQSGRQDRPIVLVDGNPFNCDCRLYDLAQKLHGYESQNTMQADFQVGFAQCSSPEALKHQPVASVPLAAFACDVPDVDCAKPCTCALRPDTNAFEMTCSKEPRVYPNMSYIRNPNIELKLTEKPEILKLNADIKVLNLSGLGLTKLPKGIIPKKLELLDLSNNNFSTIPKELFGKDFKMRLSKNPITCDCWHSNDVAILKEHYYMIEDYSSVNCSIGEFISAVSTDQLCSSWYAATVGGTLAALGVIAAVLAAIFLRYSLEIRVWLYAKGCCARWMAIDDDDRKYDAFVSFCHKDEEFVRDQLIPGLETPPYKYKLCVHYRDWIPGEWIPAQIASSVADSRRTIIVVSKNFLDSLWGRAEFRAANMSAIKERQTRVIVVLLEDITSHKELDPELKAYLSTNTYLKWGDQWFWDKIRYAMPHKKIDGSVLKTKRKLAKAKLAKKLIGGLDTQLTPEGVIVNAALAVPDKKKQQEISIEIDKLKNINLDRKLKDVEEMQRF